MPASAATADPAGCRRPWPRRCTTFSCADPSRQGTASSFGPLSDRYSGVVAVHRLTREAATGALHDVDRRAFTRLGVDQAAQYLVRPDGHVGYRSGGTDLHAVERHLARWLPGA
jgi:hypothetical protein